MKTEDAIEGERNYATRCRCGSPRSIGHSDFLLTIMLLHAANAATDSTLAGVTSNLTLTMGSLLMLSVCTHSSAEESQDFYDMRLMYINKGNPNRHPFGKLGLAFLAAAIFLAAAQVLSAQSSIIAPGAKVELLASGFKFTEGPACDKAGNVYFTDQPNDRILIWSTNGKLSTFMEKSGRSNGLSFDRKGNLWACADEKNELWRISRSRKPTVVVKDYDGKLLNGPNDVWIRPDGGVYFTDPFYRRDYWNHQKSEQDAQCVYYLEPKRNRLIRVVDDLKQPNGIIGTPDGEILYVADIGGQKTYKYGIRKDGTLSDRTLFCEMGSDGMTIDGEGNVYLTGKGVTVFDSTGRKIEQISIDAPWTANVCFGGKDGHTLFITAMQNLFGLRMRVKGAGSQ